MEGEKRYNEDDAEFVCSFLECLKVTDGVAAGQPLRLFDWQRKHLTEFYGRIGEDGLRWYRYLYLELPKKNGKSGLASGLGLYHTFADGEMNGEVYVVAADRENAGIVFNASVAMLKECPALMKRAKISESTKTIRDRLTGTVYKVLSSEAYSKHGYKPSCVIFDELHAQPNRELWDIMTVGAGDARRQPVWIVLTTAGDDPDRRSIGWEIHEKAQRILAARTAKARLEAAAKAEKPDDAVNPCENGMLAAENSGNAPRQAVDRPQEAENAFENGIEAGNPADDVPTWLPVIYSYEGDDIWNEENWIRANPSVDQGAVTLKAIRLHAQEAKQGGEAAERLFRWLRLNQWIATKSVGWIPLTLWDHCVGSWAESDLNGKMCYMGQDLSTTTDLTAVVLLFPPQEGVPEWRRITRAWIPEEAMRERSRHDRVPYDRWVRDGWLYATPGNAVDYTAIEAEIQRLRQRFRVIGLGTDPWNSRMLTQRLMQQGLDILEIPQTIAGMSPAMKDLEIKLRSREITHLNNPVDRWCFGNVRCAVDGNENTKPMKNRSTGRIDIAVASINAMAYARTKEITKKSIYETRAPRLITLEE